MSVTSDLTIVWYTAGELPAMFAQAMLGYLVDAKGSSPMITIAKPRDVPRSHIQIYRQALEGVRLATTKYVALCEDDVLYHAAHFNYRPNPGVFAYNMNAWNLYTWTDPIFSQKLGGRKNLNGLICERQLFIDAMEERFSKWPDDSKIDLSKWAEPGKYEGQLGCIPQQTEVFHTNPPNVIFSHETELSFTNLGTRKRLGEIRAYDIPYWGTAKEIRGLYGS